MLEIANVLNGQSKKRFVFHSEVDFQHSLGVSLHIVTAQMYVLLRKIQKYKIC